MTRRREKRHMGTDADDEPDRLGEEEWVEWGGEWIWAVGFTSGGAPYGLTEREVRQLEAQDQPRAGWARAKNLLQWAFGAYCAPDTEVDVGRVTKVGDGAYRWVYGAYVGVSPDPDGLSGAWAVLLPDRRMPPGDCKRWTQEVWILGQLARMELPFRVPAALGAFPVGGATATVRQFLDGIPVDLRAGHMQGIRPWELVGEIAADIHTIDVSDWVRRPPGGATRRAHGEEMLRELEDVPGPEVAAARAWATEHLPPDSPATLVHGDLLGQNILVYPDEDPGVIDWEFCCMGDPAYDLAIVTRGVRRPFTMTNGLQRLLDAYAEVAAEPISESQVRFYELCLSVKWYGDSLEGEGGEPPDQALARVVRVLRWAEESVG